MCECVNGEKSEKEDKEEKKGKKKDEIYSKQGWQSEIEPQQKMRN